MQSIRSKGDSTCKSPTDKFIIAKNQRWTLPKIKIKAFFTSITWKTIKLANIKQT